jgi:hypothetical protein
MLVVMVSAIRRFLGWNDRESERACLAREIGVTMVGRV